MNVFFIELALTLQTLQMAANFFAKFRYFRHFQAFANADIAKF